MFRSSTLFDKYLEKATSELLLEPDWESTLQLCDSIRSGETPPKYAVSAIKKKLYHQNPHVSLSALNVLESCVKNCGSLFHMELATRPFMDELRDLAKITSNEKLKNKILELIQVWAHAFRNDSSCRAVGDVMNLMKAEGFKFPVLKESDAMFTAETAPQWAEGDCCHRCRVTFGLVNRKHHCRCCGQIFCDKCSARTSAIPKYGIEKEVRVCDDCYDKLNKTTPLTVSKPQAVDVPLSSSQTTAPKASAPAGKSEQELREEEELQLAIALSKSEAETREKTPRRSSASSSAAPAAKIVRENGTTSDRTVDSLAEKERERYLNREFWEQKSAEQSRTSRRSSSPAPSAPQSVAPTPQPVITNSVTTESVGLVTAPQQSDDRLSELSAFTSNLQKTLDIFKNRMEANKIRGRPISNDSAVQSLFLNVTNMHSQLLKWMHDEEEKRMHLEELQDKLSDIGAARGALDLLRDEHRERKRREAEAQEAVRQQQMAQKLDIMRKQKQEYLQYQRQIALQRLQDQEREMQIRKEQQKYPVHQQPLPQQPPPHHLPQQPGMNQWQQQPPAPAPGYYAPSHSMPGSQVPMPHPQQQQQQQPQHLPQNQYIPTAYPPQSVYPPVGPYMSQMHQPAPPLHPQAEMGQSMPLYQPVHHPQPPPAPAQPPVAESEEPLITFD